MSARLIAFVTGCAIALFSGQSLAQNNPFQDFGRVLREGLEIVDEVVGKKQEQKAQPNQQPARQQPISGSMNDNRNAVALTQSRLAELGYLDGQADGIFGPNTQRAILSFENDQGLQATGTVTQALIEQLTRTVAKGRSTDANSTAAAPTNSNPSQGAGAEQPATPSQIEIVELTEFIYAALTNKDDAKKLTDDDYKTITRNIFLAANRRANAGSRAAAIREAQIFKDSDLGRQADFVVFEQWEKVKALSQNFINLPLPTTVQVKTGGIEYEYSFEKLSFIPLNKHLTTASEKLGGKITIWRLNMESHKDYFAGDKKLFEVGSFTLGLMTSRKREFTFERIVIPNTIELKPIPMSPQSAEPHIKAYRSSAVVSFYPTLVVTDLKPGDEAPSGRVVSVSIADQDGKEIVRYNIGE